MAESASHLDVDDRARVMETCRHLGVSELVAVDAEADCPVEPVWRIPVAEDPLREFHHDQGHFAFLLLPSNLQFAMLCTVDDYIVYAGPVKVVEALIGCSVALAQREFMSFVESGWYFPAATKARIRETELEYRKASDA